MNNSSKSPEKPKKPDNRTKKRKIGDLGETIACDFIIRRGFKVIERNYLKKYGEIDIIAQKDDITHFFEVKSVSVVNRENVIHETSEEHRPEDNIHPRKIQRLRRVIQSYLLQWSISDADWQFNVITVRLNFKTRKARVETLDNIVL